MRNLERFGGICLAGFLGIAPQLERLIRLFLVFFCAINVSLAMYSCKIDLLGQSMDTCNLFDVLNEIDPNCFC